MIITMFQINQKCIGNNPSSEVQENDFFCDNINSWNIFTFIQMITSFCGGFYEMSFTFFKFLGGSMLCNKIRIDDLCNMGSRAGRTQLSVPAHKRIQIFFQVCCMAPYGHLLSC